MDSSLGLFDCQTSIQDKIFLAHYLFLHTLLAMTDVVPPAPASMATSPVQGPPVLSFPAILNDKLREFRIEHSDRLAVLGSEHENAQERIAVSLKVCVWARLEVYSKLVSANI